MTRLLTCSLQMLCDEWSGSCLAGVRTVARGQVVYFSRELEGGCFAFCHVVCKLDISRCAVHRVVEERKAGLESYCVRGEGLVL